MGHKGLPDLHARSSHVFCVRSPGIASRAQGGYIL